MSDRVILVCAQVPYHVRLIPARMKNRLARLAGVDPDGFEAAFECHTLLRGGRSGKLREGDGFDLTKGMRAAAKLWPRFAGRHVVLVGEDVARSFGLHTQSYYRWVEHAFFKRNSSQTFKLAIIQEALDRFATMHERERADELTRNILRNVLDAAG